MAGPAVQSPSSVGARRLRLELRGQSERFRRPRLGGQRPWISNLRDHFAAFVTR